MRDLLTPRNRYLWTTILHASRERVGIHRRIVRCHWPEHQSNDCKWCILWCRSWFPRNGICKNLFYLQITILMLTNQGLRTRNRAQQIQILGRWRLRHLWNHLLLRTSDHSSFHRLHRNWLAGCILVHRCLGGILLLFVIRLLPTP